MIAYRELKRWNFQSNLGKDHLEGDRMGEGMVGGLFTKLNEKWKKHNGPVVVGKKDRLIQEILRKQWESILSFISYG